MTTIYFVILSEAKDLLFHSNVKSRFFGLRPQNDMSTGMGLE